MSNPQFRTKQTFTVPTAGLVPTGAQTVSGAVAAGANVIVLTAATTLTGTANAGDTFVVGGVTYTVLAAVGAAGNLATLTVSPAVGVGGISGGATWSSYTPAVYASIPSLASIGLSITGAPTTSGATPAGSSSIALTAATALTGQINTGDQFTISAVTYTAAGPAVAAGNIVTVPIVGVTAALIAGGTAWSAYTPAFQLLPGVILNLPAGAGIFALPGSSSLLGLTTVLLAGFPASAQVELWLFDPTATLPLALASYFYGQVMNAAAGVTTIPLASVPGALVRVKGAGTAGPTTVLIFAD